MIEMATPLFIAGRAVFKWAAVAVCIATALPVYALDPGECGTPEAMTAMLKAEGQRSIAMADEVIGTRLRAMIFTTNDDRSVGYIMRSDQDSDTKAKEFCVYRRLADIRLHDARKPGPPSAALLTAPEDDARRRCDDLAAKGTIPRETCFPLGVMLRAQERDGFRPILQGFIVHKGSDPSQAWRGTLLTVTGNVIKKGKGQQSNPLFGEGGLLLYSAMPEGATADDEVLYRPHYTPYGLSLLPN